MIVALSRISRKIFSFDDMRPSMLLLILFSIGFASAAFGLIGRKKRALVNLFCQLALATMFFLSLFLITFYNQPATFHIKYFEYGSMHFNLSFYLDHLSWIMLCLITFISFNIHSYSTRYLISDGNQSRFIGQLSLLTVSVMILVTSGNLLTAFIGWQLIGISLYLLLNHFHFNKKANQAAKKKFVINRLGDVCFLLAVVISYSSYGNSEFSTINSISSGLNTSTHTIMLGLLFIAIMTKSAQFPFHIWLIDTFEAPTPVSALMHAGIINAGGFLLARLSPALSSSPILLTILFSIGIVTAILGKFFMQTQPDIKKQLAYSTMGQMGYMVMQCGLNCFGSAVFHLIAHGFFKSTLLLNSGNNLTQSNFKNKINKHSLDKKNINVIVSLLLTMVFIIIGLIAENHFSNNDILNLFLWFFIATTLYSSIRFILISRKSITTKVICLGLLAGLYLFYLYILFNFVQFLGNDVLEHHPSYHNRIPFLILMSALVAIFLISTYYDKKISNHLKQTLFSLSYYKFNIENFYRRYLIKPLRWVGDFILCTSKTFSLKVKLAILLMIAILFILLTTANSPIAATYSTCIILMLLTLTAANRNRKGNQLISNLILMSVFYFILFILQPNGHAVAVSIFFLFNTTLILLTLLGIINSLETNDMQIQYKTNRLSIGNFYISILFILLIGLPGTASFISEFYMTHFLLESGIPIALFWLSTMILLSVVILHAMQENVFASGAFSKTAHQICPKLHIICCTTILINVIDGLFPDFLISNITKIIKMI